MNENNNENTTDSKSSYMPFLIVLIITVFVIFGGFKIADLFNNNKVRYVITNPDGIIGYGSVTVRRIGCDIWFTDYDDNSTIICKKSVNVIYPKPEDMEPKRTVTRDVITSRIPGQLILRASGRFNKGTTFEIFLNGKSIYRVFGEDIDNTDVDLNFTYERIILEKGKNHWLN